MTREGEAARWAEGDPAALAWALAQLPELRRRRVGTRETTQGLSDLAVLRGLRSGYPFSPERKPRALAE